MKARMRPAGKAKGNGGKGEHEGKGGGGVGRKGTRKLRWADCDEEVGARQGVAEGDWHKARKEQGIMWLDGSDEEQKDMRDQPEVRGVRCVDERRCGARRARSKKKKKSGTR